VLPLAGRKGNSSADARLSDRPVGHIPRDGARLPGDLGVDRDEASPVRASDSYGSGLSRPVSRMSKSRRNCDRSHWKSRR
jgi:hypothetical protein